MLDDNNFDIQQVEHHPDTHKSEKYRKLKSDILSLYIQYITIEGSIRGGKDVSALDIYALFLMLTPDRLHLVTGTSESHAIETTFEADGFGLKYLIPHGKMKRVQNKDKFVFKDFYGNKKEVHFFGNSKYNDYKKFKGVSYGSHYANEATIQHIDGLKFAEGRTVRSRWRKIIHTQNPTAPAALYYTEYEQNKIYSKEKAVEIFNKAEKLRNEYNKIKIKYEKMLYDEKKRTVRVFLREKGVSTTNKLSPKEKDVLRNKILRTKFDVILDRENELQTRYNINSAYFEYKPYYENPNNIRNGLYFRYYHYTMKDNPTITEARYQQIVSNENQNSVYFKRDILGIRSVTEDAIYDNFTEDNLYNYDLPTNLTSFYTHKNPMGFNSDFIRYLAIDYGTRDNFVILDIYLDPESATAFVEDEFRYIQEEDPQKRPGEDKIYTEKVKEMLNKREKGVYAKIIVDPAARPFINYITSSGLYAVRGKNTVKGKKTKLSEDSRESDKTINKSTGGISLVKNAIGHKKLFINAKNCPKLVQEMQSYRYDPDKKKFGEEVPLKVNDHGPDALRYFINTEIRDIKRITQIQGSYDIYEKIDAARQNTIS